MHPSSICLLATPRHEELDALNARERLARHALATNRVQPGAAATFRVWVGSCLIAVGTRLRGTAKVIAPADAGRLSPVGRA